MRRDRLLVQRNFGYSSGLFDDLSAKIHTNTSPSNNPETKSAPKDALEGSQTLNNLKIFILGTTVLVMAIAAGFWIWLIPAWQSISKLPIAADKIPLQIELIQAIAQALLWFSLLVTLYVAWRRATAAEDAVKVAEEIQITERFTRAIAQLGDDKMAIRLGGIYALERIARDSPKDHWQVMQVLTAYIRENSPSNWTMTQPQPFRPIPFDIQAILEVIGRRNSRYETAGQVIDLRMSNLTGAELEGADYQKADFRLTILQNVYFKNANLKGANLFQANIENAFLEGADLRGANLSVVWNSNQAQLDSAVTDEKTNFPEDYTT